MRSIKPSLRSLVIPGLTALSLAFLVAGPSAAQSRPAGPRIPLDARGFQIGQALTQYHQDREARAHRAPVAPAPVTEAPSPRYVTIRTPDGQGRSFLLEGPVTVVPFRPGVVTHYPR